MFRALFLVFAVRTAYGIIVKDPRPSDDEYKYWYEVQDPTTGDSKIIHEARHGDAVKGSYTVLDPDGTLRTVQYTASPNTGFKAVLCQEPIFEPIDVHPVPQEYISFYDKLNADELTLNPYLSSPPRHFTKSYQRHKYFTPASELQLQKKVPLNGQYFEPNIKY